MPIRTSGTLAHQRHGVALYVDCEHATEAEKGYRAMHFNEHELEQTMAGHML